MYDHRNSHSSQLYFLAISKLRRFLEYAAVVINVLCHVFPPQEEDLQEIIAKISSKRAEYDEARSQMAELKASFEKAEQEYKQHKEQINTVTEEADSIKVMFTEPGCRVFTVAYVKQLLCLSE